MLAVAGAFDGDGPLVVLPAGRTPGTVLLLDTKRHTAIRADAVVTAGLPVRADEAAADALSGKLPDDTMRSDSVDTVGSLPGMVRTEFCIDYKRTVGLCHNCLLLQYK